MATEGAVPVTGVCELVLEQNDLAAAEHFYADVLGFPVVERWHGNGGAVWVMAGDRTRIGLWRPQLGLGVVAAGSMSTTRWGWLPRLMTR
jgi:catechol 2,3-dioxygenase-like lactoylglutathione lyase family enzyme